MGNTSTKTDSDIAFNKYAQQNEKLLTQRRIANTEAIKKNALNRFSTIEVPNVTTDGECSNNLLSNDIPKENNEKETKAKKKTKYVNLYSNEGKQKDIILLKGRHLCECQASMHKLINNCLSCGRIVCEQEGTGPCLFCGNMVFSKEDQNIINSNGIQSRKLYNTIMESIENEGLQEALKKRDTLLEYDKTVTQRTKVIDDESEYFSSTSSWYTKEEREALQKIEEEEHKRKHASRLEKKFTFDFAGRAIIEEEHISELEEKYQQFLEKAEVVPDEIYNSPLMTDSIQYEYGDSNETTKKLYKSPIVGNGMITYKIQDKEFLEISDFGVCLSVRQPWASLLVSGIMKCEGRTWYTSHRGRLWIASASKHPTEQEITEAQNFFRLIQGDDNLEFPNSYPTGCLLGCVSVADCLPQEEYRRIYPVGVCDSPYVFICENPIKLDTTFPIKMSGSHKIYKLDRNIHQTAENILMRMSKGANKKVVKELIKYDVTAPVKK